MPPHRVVELAAHLGIELIFSQGMGGDMALGKGPAMAGSAAGGVDVSAGNASVTGVTLGSASVRPGDLYAALPGSRAHGADFAEAAVAAGAVAILTDPAGAERIAVSATPPVPLLVVPDPRSRLGELSAEIYGHPARDLLVIGVTGTNGKTTTAYLVEACLRAAGHSTGLIGTVETRIGSERVASVRTTPEAPDLHALFATMRERGVSAVVMEVSSHALTLGRVDGVVFDLAGFTNLSQDHLDFHRDMEDYFSAKASLFTPARAERGVVVVDDAWGRRLADRAGIPVETVATTSEGATWAVSDVRLGATGSTLELSSADRRCQLEVGLPGAFNVANGALAAALAFRAGGTVESVREGLATAVVPGRMEPVRAGQPFAVVVDYAHTPDAVATALSALRSAGEGRLITVVGCGGDRDPYKRGPMGEAASGAADMVVITDDNPRSEDPAAIRSAVSEGAHSVPADLRAEILVVPDRSDAIRTALAAARPGDVVALLGKGHETGQEAAGVVRPFDDREVALDVLRSLAARTSSTESTTGWAGSARAGTVSAREENA